MDKFYNLNLVINNICHIFAKKMNIMKRSEYNAYMKMPMVPAGAILDRIVRQQGRTKVDVSNAAQLIPQRLNDLIMGNRRFTPQNSMALESALGIDYFGFFYILQANHDIYMEARKLQLQHRPNLEVLTKTTFWDVDIEKLDWAKCKKWAIQRVLEYGSSAEIQELERFYGYDSMLEVYSNTENFRLPDQVKQAFDHTANL